ncbi:N-acetyltransferase [uncultured Chryseobacterium sp.]|uniref:GNAT family N-acetyltransferase n=1 Tax=uncultured Chryseobacterium sp. TaxID=259322 RepID=UPI0025EAB975|nr:N-acetyltransferase [uncultured Chryseobacterium sp.]
MTSPTIRSATPEDLPVLQHLGRQTFYETFAASNTEKAMQRYLDESFSAEKLLKELENSGSLFFLACDQTDTVGYLKINTGSAQTELQDEYSLEIERIYVKKAYHGHKIGQLLYEKALETALDRKKKYLWLGVWEENHRALAFYRKNGFTEFGKHLFRLGNEEQTDLMMRKEL